MVGLNRRRNFVSNSMATHGWLWWVGQSRSEVGQGEKGRAPSAYGAAVVHRW